MNSHLTTRIRTAALLDTAPHGPNEPPTCWLHQSIAGHGTERANPELLDAVAEIIGRRIVGVQLASGGHAQSPWSVTAQTVGNPAGTNPRMTLLLRQSRPCDSVGIARRVLDLVGQHNHPRGEGIPRDRPEHH